MKDDSTIFYILKKFEHQNSLKSIYGCFDSRKISGHCVIRFGLHLSQFEVMMIPRFKVRMRDKLLSLTHLVRVAEILLKINISVAQELSRLL